ncbi:hypothetical protein BC826DRAFT_1030181, partial [Russula brevipes]
MSSLIDSSIFGGLGRVGWLGSPRVLRSLLCLLGSNCSGGAHLLQHLALLGVSVKVTLGHRTGEQPIRTDRERRCRALGHLDRGVGELGGIVDGYAVGYPGARVGGFMFGGTVCISGYSGTFPIGLLDCDWGGFGVLR